MEKINILELLRDCPAGMELDYSLFDGVVFEEINDNDICACPILIRTKEGETWNLTSTGCWDDSPSAKCVIFPKGKTTWEGFVPPFKFKDGDVVVNASNKNSNAFIYAGEDEDYYSSYVGLTIGPFPTLLIDKRFTWVSKQSGIRFATEEEKAKLFQAIKDNGYRWNTESKTLEKIEPNFKVGDIVRSKNCPAAGSFIILEIKEDSYLINIKGHCIKFDDQDNYELVPKKFDIRTLKPLQPVLVRNTNGQVWTMNFFSHIIDTNKGLRPSIVCVTHSPNQCIPYKGNEFLRGTADECKDFYKTWE